MYALVQRYTIKDMSDLDEIVDLFKVGFIPIVKRSPGFVAYYLITAGNNILVSSTSFMKRLAWTKRTVWRRAMCSKSWASTSRSRPKWPRARC